MKNLTEYGDFKKQNKKNAFNETTKTNESAQLFDSVWKVRTRVEIPQSLINSFVKKVKDETGEDARHKWSDQEIAEEVVNFVTQSYMNIENLPSSIISNVDAQPRLQTQEDMPQETQIQSDETQIQSDETQAQSQSDQVAQTVPQSQGQGQGQAPIQGQGQGQGQGQAPSQGQAPIQGQGGQPQEI